MEISNTPLETKADPLEESFDVVLQAEETERHGQAIADLRTDVDSLQSQMTDISKASARPVLAGNEHGTKGMMSSIAARDFTAKYLRRGDHAGVELKSFSGASGPEGGFAVPQEIDALIGRTLKDISPIRSIATVVQTGSAGYRKLVTDGGTPSGWVSETAGRPETDTPNFNEIAPPTGELYANPAASQAMLDDAAFDVEAWLADEIAREFAQAEGAAFVGGSGVNQPRGFLNDPVTDEPDDVRAFGTLQYIPSGAAGDFAGADGEDALVDLGWRNAELFALGADGVSNEFIDQISAPARIGTALEPLGASGPHIVDRKNSLQVQMHNSNMHLNDADHAQLLAGKNIAAIGNEIVQFGSAAPIGNDRYILSHLLRGLGGTELEMDKHLAEEDFVLLDGIDLTEINAHNYAPFQPVTISALGRGDDLPVSRSLDEVGRALKPWSPVHPRFAFKENGDLELGWTRRSRAGLIWPDHVEIPLAEETERYRVSIASESIAEPMMPFLILSAPDVQDYRDAGVSSLSIAVRQIGQHNISDPLLFTVEI